VYTLQQGDSFGQYSVLFNEEFSFSVKSKTKVRLLKLSQDFFIDSKEAINGLNSAIEYAEDLVEEFGIPICDFKLFDIIMNKKLKFRRAITKIKNILKTKGKTWDKIQHMSHVFEH